MFFWNELSQPFPVFGELIRLQNRFIPSVFAYFYFSLEIITFTPCNKKRNRL